MNIKNIISGDETTTMYGDITLFYKSNIKNRMTFTYGNSEKTMEYICTFTYFSHLLYHMPIQDIKIFIDILDKGDSINKMRTYIEIQIHGDINLLNDIDKITISNSKYNLNKEIINKFIKTYPNIIIEVYDDKI